MTDISEAWLKRLLEALAEGPIGEEILGVARGERDLVVKEAPCGAGWIVRTAPKVAMLPILTIDDLAGQRYVGDR